MHLPVVHILVRDSNTELSEGLAGQDGNPYFTMPTIVDRILVT